MKEQLQLDKQLCFRLYTAARLITQAYYPLLKEIGLTYPQYLVMMVLWERDKQRVNDIAKRLYLETSTVTPLLKRMETEGLITRGKSGEDGREVIVSLTAKGRSYSDLVYDEYGREDPDASRRVEFKFSLKDAEMIEEMNRILSGQEDEP